VLRERRSLGARPPVRAGGAGSGGAAAVVLREGGRLRWGWDCGLGGRAR